MPTHHRAGVWKPRPFFIPLFTRVRGGGQTVENPLSVRSHSRSGINTPVLGLSSPVCGRYQLNVDFFNMIGSSRNFACRGRQAHRRGQEEEGNPAVPEVIRGPRDLPDPRDSGGLPSSVSVFAQHRSIEGSQRARLAKKRRFRKVREEYLLREVRLRGRMFDGHLDKSHRCEDGAKGRASLRQGFVELGRNITLVCAIDDEGVRSSINVEGAVDAKAFETTWSTFSLRS